jgi:hypothetical protein
VAMCKAFIVSRGVLPPAPNMLLLLLPPEILAFFPGE